MSAMVVVDLYLLTLLRFCFNIMEAIIDMAHPFRVLQHHHPRTRTRTRTRTRKLYVPLLFCVG